MNKQRRAKLRVVIDELQDLVTLIEEILGEEQEAFYNMPESFEGTDRYIEMESNVEILDDFVGTIYNVLEDMEYM